MGIGPEMGIEVKGNELLVECFACLARAGSSAKCSFLAAESLESEGREGKVKTETLLLSLSFVLDSALAWLLPRRLSSELV